MPHPSHAVMSVYAHVCARFSSRHRSVDCVLASSAGRLHSGETGVGGDDDIAAALRQAGLACCGRRRLRGVVVHSIARVHHATLAMSNVPSSLPASHMLEIEVACLLVANRLALRVVRASNDRVILPRVVNQVMVIGVVMVASVSGAQAKVVAAIGILRPRCHTRLHPFRGRS